MAKIVLDGVAREVSIAREKDATVVIVDGRRYPVSEVASLPGGISFLVDGRSHVAFVSTGKAGTRITLHGRTYLRAAARSDEDAPSHAHHGAENGRIEAPMPGAIIALHVKSGAAVKAGQPIIVLESMKMHNEIASPRDGVVARLNCKVGDQVAFGQVLAEIAAK
jgi:biotin carboxyl carrier protein